MGIPTTRGALRSAKKIKNIPKFKGLRYITSGFLKILRKTAGFAWQRFLPVREIKGNFFLLVFIAFFLHLNYGNCAVSKWHKNQSDGAQTRLIASFYYNQAGEKKLIAGIHFKISDGWKIYGHGPDQLDQTGQIGMPPTLDFKNFKNFSGYKIFWPKPNVEKEKIGTQSITYFFYNNEVILPVEIEMRQSAEITEINANLNYGLCKEICVAASEDFSLSVPGEIDNVVLREIQKFFPRQILTDHKKTADSSDGPQNISPTKDNKQNLTLISVLLLAFFGGAILNIMPCVFPVLSIKLFSVINHSDTEISRIRFAFISSIAGILSCFVFFALFTSIVKLTGNSLGWGLQFQNPYFLIFLIIILTLFTGNLLEVFEISFDQFLATILNKKIAEGEKKKNIFIPNFLSGILAVLLATPCSAPFLGTAVSFALVQNFFIIFLIFFFIGTGFALPYFILLITPKLILLLPKAGSWMVQLKQLMAGFLAATLIWLIYVLMHNIGTIPALLSAVLAIAILACCKIKSLFLKFLTIAALVIAIFYLPVSLQKQQQVKSRYYENFWIKFNEAELYRQVAAGKTIVVDITAEWCLTCKFNKIRVLQDKKIMQKLQSADIIAMRGDITRPDKKIIDFLHKNNRFAIPFNAVYGPKAKDGLLTKELLTKKELLDLIDKAQ
jgi:suppressor for copper-sensitivity B